MTIKIKPFCSAGEVFALPGGKVVAMPVSVMRLENGMTVFRVGDTTYWFNEDGEYDGPEMHMKPGARSSMAEIKKLLVECQSNRDVLPSELYFDEDDERRKTEIALAKPSHQGTA